MFRQQHCVEDLKVTIASKSTIASTLSPAHEKEIASHIIQMESRFFGLTTKDLSHLVFDFAEKNHIPNSFNNESCMARWKWVRGFLKRNKNISLRTPENT